MRSKVKRMILLAPLAILGVVLFIAIGGTIVLLLWNWLAPALFGWHPITFWQALGLLALCRILFGGFGGHRRSRIRRRIEERCESMTPEERERFRQRMRERWGHCEPAGDSEER